MIWKYTLEVVGEQVIGIPEGGKILHVGNQNGNICLWVLIPDISASVRPRFFKIVGTGHPFDEKVYSKTHIGTVIINPFVWHVFESVGE